MKQSTWSLAARNAKLNAVRGEFDNGYARLYDGTQPESSDLALTGQRLLAELRFQRRAFPAAATNGMLIAAPLIPDADAKATGRPTWYRCSKADGVTALHDGSIGALDANGIFAAASIVQHAIVECPEFVIVEASAVPER